METYIISLGGSIINPSKINVDLLKKFVALINSQKNNFIIVCGGGYINKEYNLASKQISDISNEDLDWIGIMSSRLNAELVRASFGKLAHPVVIYDPTKKIQTKKRIIIGAGYKPGWSTDNVSVLFAENYNAKTIINLSNINYVYDKDPNKYPDAKKLTEISWKDFKKIVGTKWEPRMNAPFDPIATKRAEKNKMTAYVMNGNNVSNLEDFLLKKRFIGTKIS